MKRRLLVQIPFPPLLCKYVKKKGRVMVAYGYIFCAYLMVLSLQSKVIQLSEGKREILMGSDLHLILFVIAAESGSSYPPNPMMF
jgi:glycopeptide antibiotics resistance protein